MKLCCSPCGTAVQYHLECITNDHVALRIKGSSQGAPRTQPGFSSPVQFEAPINGFKCLKHATKLVQHDSAAIR